MSAMTSTLLSLPFLAHILSPLPDRMRVSSTGAGRHSPKQRAHREAEDQVRMKHMLGRNSAGTRQCRRAEGSLINGGFVKSCCVVLVWDVVFVAVSGLVLSAN